MDIAKLHETLAAVAPIDGVSVGSAADKATWKIAFQASATSQQMAQAQTIIDGFDASQPPDALSQWDMTSLKIAFNHENRIRALEAKAPITLAQFKTAVRALL